MQIITDENGYVVSYALVGTLMGGVDVDDPATPEQTEHFREHYVAYRVEDGVLAFDEERDVQNQDEAEAEEIRIRRERECFPIVNRGQLWYEMLTDTQREELAAWYRAWLDAPETKIIPDRLEWLE